MTEAIYPEELQEGYKACSMCGFTKASVHSREATKKTWWNLAEPAHLRIICLCCEHVTLVKPGTTKVTGLYIGVGT